MGSGGGVRPAVHSASPSIQRVGGNRTARLPGVGALLPLLQFSLSHDVDPQRPIDPDGSSAPVFQQPLHARNGMDPIVAVARSDGSDVDGER